MKTLYETADYSEALVVKGLIEKAGFLVYLSNFNAATAMPHLTPGLGLKVMVTEEDYDAALALLSDVRAASNETSEVSGQAEVVASGKKKGPAWARPLWMFLFFWLLLFLTVFGYEAYYYWQEGEGLDYYCPQVSLCH